jgi:predicted phage terminase large subunit-like protein
MNIAPQPGPQARFLATPADIAVFGGAAGGGKSYAIIMDALRYLRVPGYSAVYFRRSYPEIVAPDGLWELATRLFPLLSGQARENVLDWRFPSGARVIMRHLQYDRDRLTHQGAQYCALYYDELIHFTNTQFWYLLSRARSTCGVRPYVRATCNPDPDSFVFDLIRWWIDDDGYPIPERDGVLRWFVRDGDTLRWGDTPEEAARGTAGMTPLSMTFIGSRLEDNPALLARDPDYGARLDALQRVDRMRLREGNWLARYSAGTMFQERWFPFFDSVPGPIRSSVRAWDKGATAPHDGNPDPDWTRGVLIHRMADGSPVRYVVADVVSLRANPGEVDRAMQLAASRDGRSTTIAIWQDPGQAGVVDVAHTRRVLDGYHVRVERATHDKVTYAKPFSSQCEGSQVGLLRGAWNREYLSELEAFPDGGHDDQVDATSLAYRMLSAGISSRAPGGGHSMGSKWRV